MSSNQGQMSENVAASNPCKPAMREKNCNRSNLMTHESCRRPQTISSERDCGTSQDGLRASFVWLPAVAGREDCYRAMTSLRNARQK